MRETRKGRDRDFSSFRDRVIQPRKGAMPGLEKGGGIEVEVVLLLGAILGCKCGKADDTVSILSSCTAAAAANPINLLCSFFFLFPFDSA